MQILECDILIIGSGMAGCSAALQAAKEKASVILATRACEPFQSNTYYAQGGIIFKGEEDTEALFISDFQNAGKNLCYPPALKQLWEEGPKLVQSILIEELNVPFAKTSNGKLHLTMEAAHSLPRIVHVADQTGKAIQEDFLNALQSFSNVTFLTKATAIDLLTLSHHSKNRLDLYLPPTCFGAFFYKQETQEVIAVKARETILATGGLGELYLHTTNPPGSRGDGYAMAYRAGARLMNMEYVQFHPTSLYLPHGKRFLISEAVRGEGGKLVNAKGEPFMQKYHPLGDLAPRDVVAQSILAEMLATNSDCVFLDITHKEKSWIQKRFPHIYEECLKAGIDMAQKPVPVVPAAHYACGGVAVDLEGKTNIRRLYAVGEVACTGVHGANRLASSSLLEGLVWGTKAGLSAVRHLREESFSFPEIESWHYEKEEADSNLIQQDWMTIRQTMWNYVGLIRTPKRLERAADILSQLQREIEVFYRQSELSDELIGLRHGIQTAQLVLHAARLNRDNLRKGEE
jgi:L-aspartate oxidase